MSYPDQNEAGAERQFEKDRHASKKLYRENPGECMLRRRIIELAEQHGSLRAAAKVLGVTAGYLCRLRDGEKTNPSSALLRRMKLRRIVEIRYERMK